MQFRGFVAQLGVLAIWPLACANPGAGPPPAGPAPPASAPSAPANPLFSAPLEGTEEPGKSEARPPRLAEPPPLRVESEPGAEPPAQGQTPAEAGARPWLGIEMRKAPAGVEVQGVFPGSAAASAGLLPGDLLLSLGDTPLSTPPDLHSALADKAVGERIVLRVRRGQGEQRLNLVLGAKPETGELLRSLYLGHPAPSLSSLRSVQGSLVPSLLQNRGKVVVLEFWATWCVACRILAPELNRWHAELSAQGVRVLGVSVEPYDEVVNNLPQLEISYPVFVDETTEVSQAYRATALPSLFLIDRDGVIRDVVVGYAPAQIAQLKQKLVTLLDTP